MGTLRSRCSITLPVDLCARLVLLLCLCSRCFSNNMFSVEQAPAKSDVDVRTDWRARDEPKEPQGGAEPGLPIAHRSRCRIARKPFRCKSTRLAELEGMQGSVWRFESGQGTRRVFNQAGGGCKHKSHNLISHAIKLDSHHSYFPRPERCHSRTLHQQGLLLAVGCRLTDG